MLHVSDHRRRVRLGQRHALARRVGTVEEAVASVVCLHATEPPSVHLAVAARSEASHADVERALYDDRSVVKQLAMRRTVFAFPRDLLPAAWGSASARVHDQLATRLAKEVQAAGFTDDGSTWVRATTAAVERCLAAGPATTAELRERVPAMAERLDISPGKSYGVNTPVAPRVLTVLAASGRVLRGANAGDWKLSRPRWTLTEDWLPDVPAADDAHEGYRRLVGAWLSRFGPGTEDDLVWWLGATKAAVRRALAELDAVEVSLDSGTGWLLPDDLEETDPDEPWAALLPVLDPTVMGWKQRSFYLDAAHVDRIFDRNGNAGTTAWWRGRVVGTWVQDPDGVVGLVLLDDVGREARAALDAEAERLTAWLGGQRIASIYASPLARSVR